MAVGEADEVHVWLVGDDPPPGLETLLDEDERRRAASLADDGDRRRFTAVHAAARLIVGERLGAPPRELRWQDGPHGKPELDVPWVGVEVSLSHSDGPGLVALCASRAIGADIERVSSSLDMVAMARRFFPPAEASYVAAPPDAAARAGRFALLWTRKEAVVKAAGGRLLPRGVAVPVLGEASRVVEYEDDGVPPGRYRVADLPAPRGFRAAVALAGDGPFHAISHAWRWHTGAPTSIAARPTVSDPGS